LKQLHDFSDKNCLEKKADCEALFIWSGESQTEKIEYEIRISSFLKQAVIVWHFGIYAHY
jgi:hypothetical protein